LGKIIRTCLLAGIAAAALCVGAPAMAKGAANKRLASIDAPINPFYGQINPFYGSINPFYGLINPFYGDISPFWGDNTQFWGKINPFWGSIQPFYGDIDPFWGNITPFSGAVNPFWGKIQPFWRDAGPQWGALDANWRDLQMAGGGDYSDVQLQLSAFIADAASFWGAAVTSATHKDFMSGFAAPLLSRYGIDPDNAASLANVGPQQRAGFFLAWYDGLMNFAGADHVDWWMGAVHWSPALTQVEGLGTQSVVGVLDSSIAAHSDIEHFHFSGGYQVYVNDHGAAVASLIAARHDKQGVMGIAPKSLINLYNPFDASGTASWSDVQAGINKLARDGSTVINASLGVPGTMLSQEWSNILTSAALAAKDTTIVLVKAAGNDGMAQRSDIAWAAASAPQNLLLVGSVGPTGQISQFSNTPGEACILIAGTCSEADKLKYRFVVAPGELILVSDNNGGVTRLSGTSFAAPLVTGAVALLQDRWPWLQKHAPETVQIILQSADDLGDPGVDPVYGWGELDIEASQSPLAFDNLMVFQPVTTQGTKTPPPKLPPAGTMPTTANWNVASLQSSVLAPGQLALWQNQGAYVIAFEPIGSTYRDFTIPLSSLLIGKNISVGGLNNPAQAYLYERLIDWAGGAGFTGFASNAISLPAGSWNVELRGTRATDEEQRSGALAMHGEVLARDHESGLGVRLGEGSGTHALLDGNGFAMRSDFEPITGGVDPILGFASGGAYAQGLVQFGGLQLGAGFTQKSDDHAIVDPQYGRRSVVPLPANTANATIASVRYTVTSGFDVSAAATLLHEDTGLFGAQGGGSLDLAGSRSRALTLGATMLALDTWQISASATLANTTGPSYAALKISDGGLASTAFALSAQTSDLFEDGDVLHLGATQPLHIESGSLVYSGLAVVDRSDGAVGLSAQRWDIAAPREYRLEASYETPILSGGGTLGLFSLLDLNPPLARPGLSVSFGAQLSLATR
jgi:hypothetical protein